MTELGGEVRGETCWRSGQHLFFVDGGKPKKRPDAPRLKQGLRQSRQKKKEATGSAKKKKETKRKKSNNQKNNPHTYNESSTPEKKKTEGRAILSAVLGRKKECTKVLIGRRQHLQVLLLKVKTPVTQELKEPPKPKKKDRRQQKSHLHQKRKSRNRRATWKG